MSITAQANGAQREIGMYAGVDGAVRKLFDEIGISNPYGVSGTEAGIQQNVPFDVSGYTLVIAQVFVGYGSGGNQFGFLVILPKWKLSYKIKAYGDQQPENVTMSNSVSAGESWDQREASYNPIDNTLTTSQPVYGVDMVWLYA